MFLPFFFSFFARNTSKENFDEKPQHQDE